MFLYNKDLSFSCALRVISPYFLFSKTLEVVRERTKTVKGCFFLWTEAAGVSGATILVPFLDPKISNKNDI